MPKIIKQIAYMKSIKPNKPKAMIVFYKILFPVREEVSGCEPFSVQTDIRISHGSCIAEI